MTQYMFLLFVFITSAKELWLRDQLGLSVSAPVNKITKNLWMNFRKIFGRGRPQLDFVVSWRPLWRKR